MPATATFNPTSCTLNITKNTNIEGSSILTQIDFEAKFQRVNGRSPTVIASAAAVLIKRALYHNGSFLSILDSHSDELQKFGVKFFDKNGKFRQDVYVNGEDEDSFHRGTGCWGKGRELDSYDARIYFILDLAVTERASLRIKNDFLFFQSVPGSDEETLFKEVNRFTFNHGFRRVRQTDYLAYSPNPNHPSRSIPISEDAKGASQFAPDPQEVPQRLPLHFIISADNFRRTRCSFTGTDAIQSLFQNYAQNLLLKPVSDIDSDNHTILHVAAQNINLEVLRTLLTPPLLSVTQDILEVRDCVRGYTALNLYEFGMNDAKTFSESLLDRWDGHADDALRCAYLLRKAIGRANVRDIETEDEMQMMFCSSSLHRELVNFKPNVPDNQLYSRTEIETLDISLFYSIPYKNKEHVTNDLVNAVLQVLHQTSNRTSTSRLPTP
ncbi:hypothetical protein C8Q75DRAFT_736274 [Abortiporus biennis]|nr:hypothetical protein C8Q75DRAFT_736274 [Abortiporus biennis]